MSVYSVRKSLIPLAKKIVLKLTKEGDLDEKKLKLIRNQLTKKNGGVLPKNLELIAAYNELIEKGKIKPSQTILKVIQKKKSTNHVRDCKHYRTYKRAWMSRPMYLLPGGKRNAKELSE
ncbi:hypothetical protein KJ742_02230 [Patescibacteria group bacterium]|nr:hypothetical protein [Patescibacteria group bacterium]